MEKNITNLKDKEQLENYLDSMSPKMVNAFII